MDSPTSSETSSETSSRRSPGKRRLSEESCGTPPNKRRRRAKRGKERDSESLSPTKALSKKIECLNLQTEAALSPRSAAIAEAQDKLLTRDDKNESCDNSPLKGREKEHSVIWNFLSQRLQRGTGGSLYICGSPGTGKTATMLKIERAVRDAFGEATKQTPNGPSGKVRKGRAKKAKNAPLLGTLIKINAMSLRKPDEVYSVLCRELSGEEKTGHASIRVLPSLLKARQGAVLVIIDEMDALLRMRQAVLYQLFEWSVGKGSLIVVGIANSIDLTDRFLPRLRARHIDPELLIFEPYSKRELRDIVTQKILDACDDEDEDEKDKGKDKEKAKSRSLPLFDPIAVELCAQKVAKASGDLRQCMQVCRCALDDLLEAKTPRVTFQAMQRVLRRHFASPQSELLRNLPNHQRIVVVTVTLLHSAMREKLKKTRLERRVGKKGSKPQAPSAKLTLCKVEKFYQYVVSKQKLPKASHKEFESIVRRLIDDGVFGLRTKSQQLKAQTEISVCLSQDEVMTAVENNPSLLALFQEDFAIPSRFI